MIKKNTYVLVKKTILNKEQRTAHIPEDTKCVDFIMKIKGNLTHDANIGEQVIIITETKRVIEGTLIEINPAYTHSFGEHVEEVMQMKDIILSEVEDISHD